MMNILEQHNRFAEILGIPPNKITGLSIDVPLDDFVHIEVSLLADKDQLEGIINMIEEGPVHVNYIIEVVDNCDE